MQVRADVATLIKLVTEEHAAKKAAAAKPRRPSPETGKEKDGAEARARPTSPRRKHEGRQHKRRHQSPTASATGGLEHELSVVEIVRT